MLRTLLAFLLLLSAALAVQAQTIAVQGMMGGRPLLVVNGGQPRPVAVGDTWQGVKVVSTTGDQAVLEVDGRRHTLRVGESPGSYGGGQVAVGGSRIVLTADSSGHFFSQGSINGRATTFVVDTGASLVGLGSSDAERLGIDYKSGQTVRMATANGTATAWLVRLSSVRLGDIELREVDAVVGSAPMPYVLLGNSFLRRFSMRRDNEQMVLERRY